MKPSVALVSVVVAVAFGIACRETEPKTPPNSPLPKIEKPSDPSGPPTSPLGDGGASSSAH